MAQEMVISKELSYLAEFSVGMFEDASYSATSVPNTISIRQNRFWLVSNDGRMAAPDPLKLHFVTLGVKAPEGRTYYEGAYDPENSGPPDCFSYDGVTPDQRGRGRQAETCGACTQSMWGSATSKLTGAMVPACRQHKDIVVKIMGVEGMWLLRIPPASIKKQWGPLVARVKQVAEKEQAKHGKAALTMLTCVVEATFDDTAQGVLNFQPLGYLSQAEAPAVITLAKDIEAVREVLWGPEGTTRLVQWSIKLGQAQDVQQPGVRQMERAEEELLAEAAQAQAAAPKKEPVKVRTPTKVEAKPAETKAMQAADAAGAAQVAAMRAAAQSAPAKDKEVDDILQSMGVFDG